MKEHKEEKYYREVHHIFFEKEIPIKEKGEKEKYSKEYKEYDEIFRNIYPKNKNSFRAKKNLCL